MSTAAKRIVVFTGDLSYSVRKGIVDIDEGIDGLTWLVLLHAPAKTVGQLLRSQLLNLRRNGWRWLPYQMSDLWRRLIGVRSADAAPDAPGAEYASSAFAARPNVRIVRIRDIHSDESIAEAAAFKPALGLAIAAPILKRRLFGVPELGTINLHKGKLPEFRGMPPAFWELWNDASSVGCTVHWVDDKLDTGNVVAEARVERAEFSTLRALQLQLDEVGADLMRSATGEILAGRAVAHPQAAGAGKTYRKPTLSQVEVLRRKMRPTALRSDLPGRLKDVVRTAGYWLWRAGGWRLLAPRITVLLYHRVSDDVRDNLTVGIEQFDRQLALLARHCRVLSIEEVLASTSIPRSSRPLVAVTFDDGYLDNYRHAAPSLRRHQIPAAFFVSTGIVGADGRFPHDLRRGNPPIAVMTWDQLREMRRWGFVIGSHTVNHIDCASEPEPVVRDELATSMTRLEHELGVRTPIFGYPYGGREHMTAERLEWVRAAGYVGCLSAHGGSNIGRVDRFDVLRRGLHWEFSDRALLFASLGLF